MGDVYKEAQTGPGAAERGRNQRPAFIRPPPPPSRSTRAGLGRPRGAGKWCCRAAGEAAPGAAPPLPPPSEPPGQLRRSLCALPVLRRGPPAGCAGRGAQLMAAVWRWEEEAGRAGGALRAGWGRGGGSSAVRPGAVSGHERCVRLRCKFSVSVSCVCSK